MVSNKSFSIQLSYAIYYLLHIWQTVIQLILLSIWTSHLKINYNILYSCWFCVFILFCGCGIFELLTNPNDWESRINLCIGVNYVDIKQCDIQEHWTSSDGELCRRARLPGVFLQSKKWFDHRTNKRVAHHIQYFSFVYTKDFWSV